MTKPGKLYLLPNTLGGESIQDIMPKDVIDQALSLRHFVVENQHAFFQKDYFGPKP